MLPKSHGNLTGTQIGGYTLVRPLHGVGNNTSYLGCSEVDGNLVTVRPFRPLNHSTNADVRRLVDFAKRCRHPHLMAVLDISERNGVHFLITEHVDGVRLDELMNELLDKDRHLTLAEMVTVGVALTDALACLHSQAKGAGIPNVTLYGLVEPSNVVLSKDGVIKLECLSGQKNQEHGYQAPEVLMGHPSDGSGEVFSVGVLLLELLTGRRIFQRADPASTISAVLSGTELPRPAHVDFDLQPRVYGLFDRLLSHKRDQRPASWEALHQELLRLGMTLDVDVAEQLSELASLGKDTDLSDVPDLIDEPERLPTPELVRDLSPEPSFTLTPLPGSAENGLVLTLSVAAATTVIVATLVFLGLQLAAGAGG